MRNLFVFSLAGILFFFLSFEFAQAQSIEKGVSVTVTVPEAQPIPPVVGGGAPLIPARVIFKGKAYPKAFLFLLVNQKVTATFFADSTGFFKKELTGLSGGKYTFGIFAEDTEGRESVTLNFKIDILRGTITTISGIFIPPTISLSSAQVERGEKIVISGQSFPQSKVFLFISPGEIIRESFSNLNGIWSFLLDTSFLKTEEYQIRAKTLFEEGEQSQFSKTLSFFVKSPKCRGSDLNFDGKVNIIDFSILLFFWYTTTPQNICVDINQDNLIDLVDFSIMMHQWTS